MTLAKNGLNDMTDEELKKEAEKFIIKRYGIDKCYVVDTEETRRYMSNDVHIGYEEEYQCYLAGLKAKLKDSYTWKDVEKSFWEGFDTAKNKIEKRITELEKACHETQELLDKQIEATYKLDKENAELKENLAYAKAIMRELLVSSNEYAKQNAENFIKE